MLIADKGAVGLLLPANHLIDPATLSRGQRSRGEKGRDGPPNREGVATWLAIAALRKSDVPAAPLPQRAGLWIHDFEDRQSRISAAAQAKFLEDAARAMDDGAFALHLAAKANPREGGLLFYVASAAKLDQFVDYFAIPFRIRMNLGHASPGASAAPVAASEMMELPRWPLSA
jgi:hypothetical protein